MRSELLALGGAVLLHAALLGMARFIHAPDLSRFGTRELESIEIDLNPPPAVKEAPVPAANVEPAPAPAPEPAPVPERAPEPRLKEAPAPRAPQPQAVAPVESSPQPQPTASAAPPPSKFDQLPPDDGRGALTLPGVPGLGSPIWSVPGMIPSAAPAAAAPTVSPAARPIDRDIAGRVVRDAMTARDKDLGLDFPGGGTVAAAVREMVQGSDVPNEARASIEFRVGPGGQVLGVRVVGFNGGTTDTWARVAAAAAARLAGRVLAMTATYAKGAIVTIDVSSSLQAPSGSKGGFKGGAASFDVSNIGAHATRVVRASPRVAAVR